MLIEWSDDLSVGIQEIDEQHKVLVGLVNDMHDAIMNIMARKRQQISFRDWRNTPRFTLPLKRACFAYSTIPVTKRTRSSTMNCSKKS